ncbi:DUF2510 domain-containing protein [Rhodococcus chondri]|uniref:DUF2510 domain-containing protein n=1 Tax=Rhodococcus chondri TaxID=3065941 RepID=A0ABU7JM66_9NOCA|nr:DUF2510 domain-containing protein [Rhodococcus sp. CC-R104]MEE2030954.1 DUF2510 domain-containing protein [Rhodococcus sp. CC-R104]
MTSPQLPGWYPEPGYDRLERWWNGQHWTRAARPRISLDPALGTAVATSRASMSTDAKRAWLITAIAAAAFTIWGYTTVASEPAPAPAPPSVSNPVTHGSGAEPRPAEGGAPDAGRAP